MCWMCDTPGASFEVYLDDVVRPVIDRCGWAVQAVGARGGWPELAYTVGLTAQGRPELVVSGKSPPAAHELLEAVLAGDPPRAGYRYDLPLGPPLQVVRVTSPARRLTVARALYGARVAGTQLVWADGRGRWPWETRSARWQHVLGDRELPGAA